MAPTTAPARSGKAYNVWGWPSVFVIDLGEVARGRGMSDEQLDGVLARLVASAGGE